MDIDEALEQVGGYRRWHLAMFVLLGCSTFMPYSLHGLVVVFSGWEPPHYCRVPDQRASLNKTIPTLTGSDGRETPSKCYMYENNSSEANVSSSTTECLYGWEYTSGGYYTMVEQWDLVCRRNYLSEVSQTLFQVGYLSSSLGFTFLMDRFGRKYVHIVTHLAICALGTGMAFADSYVLFVALKIILGMIVVLNMNSGLTHIIELFDSKRRTFAGIGLEVFWVAGVLMLALAAYFMRDWRALQVVISCTSAVWIVYFWILPESPLWLTAVGRFEEAEVILQKIARWNGVSLSHTGRLLQKPISLTCKLSLEQSDDSATEPLKETTCETDNEHLTARSVSLSEERSDVVPASEIHDHIDIVLKEQNGHKLLQEIKCETNNSYSNDSERKESKIIKEEPHPVCVILRDPYLRRVLFISNLLWFANCLVYYGLMLGSPWLAGNRFINFVIMGLVELPAIFLALYSADRFGRRLSVCVFHVLAGIPLAVILFVPKLSSSGEDLSPLTFTLVILSKFCITVSFVTVLLYTRELFPTLLRGTGGAICQVLGNVANIIAPFSVYLLKTDLYWLPNVAFGAISILGGVLVLLLPETARKPLPQTVADVHLMFKSIALCK